MRSNRFAGAACGSQFAGSTISASAPVIQSNPDAWPFSDAAPWILMIRSILSCMISPLSIVEQLFPELAVIGGGLVVDVAVSAELLGCDCPFNFACQREECFCRRAVRPRHDERLTTIG